MRAYLGRVHAQRTVPFPLLECAPLLGQAPLNGCSNAPGQFSGVQSTKMMPFTGFKVLRRTVALLLPFTLAHARLRPRSVAAGSASTGPVSEEKGLPVTAEGRFLQRPIITGCLAECGFQEQSCVTECQVCVEKNECDLLDDECKPCFEAVHATKAWNKRARGQTLDSGGAPLIHEGIRQEYVHLKLEALDSQRHLRTARAGVLKAQREAEWATEERKSTEQNMEMAKKVLKDAEDKVDKWKLQNANRLKAMREKTKKQRGEEEAARKELAKAKRRLKRAKWQLRNETLAAAEKESELKFRRLVQKRRKAVSDAEKALAKRQADADWLDRGLRKRVVKAREGVRDAREDLLTARAMERVSRERREDAKKAYVKAAEEAQSEEKAAAEMKGKLLENPVPTYTPKFARAAPERAAAHALSGCWWCTLVVFLVTSITRV